MNKLIIRLTLALLLIQATYVSAEKQLSFTTFESSLSHTFKAVLTKAYQHIGYKIVVQHLPGLRAIRLSNSGAVDGELYRIKKINQTFPNLIRVPVAIFAIEFRAFTKGVKFEVDGWESLAPFRVGYLRGTKVVEKNVTGKQVIDSDNYNKLFHLLNNDRLDIVVATKDSGLAQLSTFNQHDMNLLSPAIMTYPLYHFIHKKNKALLPKITAVLENMKAAGEFENIARQVAEKKPVTYK